MRTPARPDPVGCPHSRPRGDAVPWVGDATEPPLGADRRIGSEQVGSHRRDRLRNQLHLGRAGRRQQGPPAERRGRRQDVPVGHLAAGARRGPGHRPSRARHAGDRPDPDRGVTQAPARAPLRRAGGHDLPAPGPVQERARPRRLAGDRDLGRAVLGDPAVQLPLHPRARAGRAGAGGAGPARGHRRAGHLRRRPGPGRDPRGAAGRPRGGGGHRRADRGGPGQPLRAGLRRHHRRVRLRRRHLRLLAGRRVALGVPGVDHRRGHLARR